jgi:PAS domain S-box-containing protein
MAERNENLAEILASALSEFEEGIAVLDDESRVLFWNPAAMAITGYASHDLLGRTLPPEAYRIDPDRQAAHTSADTANRTSDPRFSYTRPIHVELHHRQGHTLPAMLRRTPLRNEMGKRSGTLLRFHPVDEIDALPHGTTEDDSVHESHIETSQAEMEDRLDEAWHEWNANAIPFGVLWITVDQASMLRKTHGRDASEAMLAIIERSLLHGLRPSEVLGRWGTNEFLALCHERTAELLETHACHLAGLTHAADFRWWGDRINLTLSVGAAQATRGETLANQLQRARKSMEESIYAGGNHAALGQQTNSGGDECSQS